MAKVISVRAVRRGLKGLRLSIETNTVSSYVANREEEMWYALAELYYPHLLTEILGPIVSRISPGSHSCFYRSLNQKP